ncbi:hypothetical protein EJ04DRAFT_424217 [Polyplosphaeria fusca]|uniref:ELP1 three-helical bundle domain-containing protein n=1 Tax=Polyplosphaeria fusca TaxID=682080 RepID=A0A9P4V5F9_9PLEO|nr:hypothetical protein EJ04DRAFT_424217 [Polyplosphaeria fusca]
MRTQLSLQAPRLAALRAAKAADPATFYDAAFTSSGGADIPDNVSLAPTDTTGGATFMTRYTNRTGTVNSSATRKTSKKKAREERKRARGKKGTVYEEEYLVNSIERLVERVNGMHGEVERLVEGLVRRGMRERARAVEGAVEGVLERCREVVAEMYAGQEEREKEKGEGEQMGMGVGGLEGEMLRPMGADATLWDSMQEVERKREPPVVKKFERLSLLG